VTLLEREERLERLGWTIISKFWPSLGTWDGCAKSKRGVVCGYLERPTREEARLAVVEWAEETQLLLDAPAVRDTEPAPAMLEGSAAE
jgi:hypothetical protein